MVPPPADPEHPESGSPARQGVLVVFAKRPTPGRVKTRMCPPLSPEQAAELYAAMLQDVLVASQAAARMLGLDPVLAVDPPGSAPDLARMCPAGFRVVAQRGADLSERMAWAAAEAAASGATRILLRGSDSPALSAEGIGAALAALDEHDLVICPDRDGGYTLVGLRGVTPGLFDHAMSTASVLVHCIASAKKTISERHVSGVYTELPSGRFCARMRSRSTCEVSSSSSDRS